MFENDLNAGGLVWEKTFLILRWRARQTEYMMLTFLQSTGKDTTGTSTHSSLQINSVKTLKNMLVKNIEKL